MNPARRALRLALAALLAGLLAYAAVNLGLGWLYVARLTHPPCLLPNELAGNYPFQEITLTAEDGVQVRAWYYPARNGHAILVMGGLQGALGQRQPHVGSLLEAGYGVLQIDSRACARPPTAVTLGADEALDAAAGLEYLLARPEVEAVGAYGFSMGAAALLRAAARGPQIAGVAAEGSYFNLGDDFLETGEPLPPATRLLLAGVAGAYWLQTGVNPWQVSPLDDLPRISPRPVLLIFGEQEMESARARQQFEAARQPKTLWVVPGGAHGTNFNAAGSEYKRRLLEFFEKLFVDDLALHHDLIARVGVADIVTGAAVDLIDTRPAVDHVVAVVAEDHIVAVIAADRVVP